jgi:hypothetical protein
VTEHDQGGEVRHETRDVDPRAVVRATLIVIVVTVVTAAVSVLLLRLLADREAARFATPPPAARREADRQPPEPRLQENPILDVQQLREQERALLNGTAWVNEKAGIVRIPIEQAMDLLVERGLPPVPARPADLATPAPAEPSR